MPLVPVVKGLPVLLPPHDDSPDFGDPGQHYHIDYRYCNGTPLQEQVVFSEESPTWEILEPIREDYDLVQSSILILLLLTDKYYDSELKCGKCPHKGLFVSNGQCPGHGLSFKNNKVNTELYIQLIDIPEKRKPITREQMKNWVAKKEGLGIFEFEPFNQKLIKGIEVVNKDGRSLAKILFKDQFTIPQNGGQVEVKIL